MNNTSVSQLTDPNAVAQDFQIWVKEMGKYILEQDFWPWLEQAFIDGQKIGLKKAAAECLNKHVNGNFKYDTREECARAINSLKGTE